MNAPHTFTACPSCGSAMYVARPFKVAEFSIDGARIYRHGCELRLTAKDFEVASLLLRNIGAVLTRERIYESVWGRTWQATSRTLDTYVSRVRSALGLRPENGWFLSAVYRRGYCLKHQ